MSAQDKVGKKVGLLTLLHIIGRTPDRDHTGMFRCDCGNEIERNIINTFRNKDRRYELSCGCSNDLSRPGKKARRGFDGEMANLFIRGML